jgi:hypothetical protein
MGAGSSVETYGKLDMSKECGCIYSCGYSDNIVDDNIGLMKCCYSCLEKLRQKKFDFGEVDNMRKSVSGDTVDRATRSSNSWMTAARAIQEAKQQGIRSVEEFLNNSDVLQKYRR